QEQTFELILYDPSEIQTPTGDGEILFQYLQASLVDRGTDNTYATVGIQDYRHLRGLGLTYANHYIPGCDTIRDGRAILITTRPPDRYLSIRKDQPSVPTHCYLSSPYPNPFNQSFNVRFGIAEKGEISLNLLDLQGRIVENLVKKVVDSGHYQSSFSLPHLPSGIYILRLEVQGRSWTRKVHLIR
ncbi:MAG: T9SS type A sorting domain-containing protein, partial [bacterium]